MQSPLLRVEDVDLVQIETCARDFAVLVGTSAEMTFEITLKSTLYQRIVETWSGADRANRRTGSSSEWKLQSPGHALMLRRSVFAF